MTDELTTAKATVQRKGAHSTFKTVKDMSFSTQVDFKALTMIVPTDFTSHILSYTFISTHISPHHWIVTFELYTLPEEC